jgi:hypothetical protein
VVATTTGTLELIAEEKKKKSEESLWIY